MLFMRAAASRTFWTPSSRSRPVFSASIFTDTVTSTAEPLAFHLGRPQPRLHVLHQGDESGQLAVLSHCCNSFTSAGAGQVQRRVGRFLARLGVGLALERQPGPRP